MSPKQLKMRQALISLHLECPVAVAQDVSNSVMDAVAELEANLEAARNSAEKYRANWLDLAGRCEPPDPRDGKPPDAPNTYE